MEGGTDHDLRILDLPSEEEEEREKLASASGGAEPPKREDAKTMDGDRKPSSEKDKNDKVRSDLCQCSLISRDVSVLLLIVKCATGGKQLCPQGKRHSSRRRCSEGGGTERRCQRGNACTQKSKYCFVFL